jgi:hypothetical protein
MSSMHRPQRKLLLRLSLPIATATLCLWTGLPASAALIDIEIRPPVPRVEVVPAPRRGFVWAPGFWEWRGREHVWVGGHWERERRGHHWIPAHWDEHGGHYRFEEGHWD